MSKAKRILIITLALMLAVVMMLTGCTTKNPATTETTTGTVATTESLPNDDPAAKKLDISFLGWNAANIVDGNAVEAMLEQKFNVDIKIPKVDVYNQDQLKLTLASGEMPEFLLSYEDDDKLYEEDQLTRTIPRSLVQKYMPKYYEKVNATPFLWDKANKTNEDEFVSLFEINDSLFDNNIMTLAIKYNWVENLKLKVPGNVEEVAKNLFMTDTAFTLDEYTEYLRAFTEDDPDQNGAKDTVGQSGYPHLFHIYTFFNAFGLDYYNNSKAADGSAVEMFNSPMFKEATKYLQSVYQKGYIDKEVWTIGIWDTWKKFDTNKSGMVPVSTDYLQAWAAPRPPQSRLNADPNNKVLLSPGVQAYPDVGIDPMYNTSPKSGPYVVRKDVSDEKLIRFLQILEYIIMDPEGSVLVNAGKEGRDYYWDGEPFKSSIVQRPDVQLGGNTGIGVFGQSRISATFKYYAGKYSNAAAKYIMGPDAIWAKYRYYPYKKDLEQKTKSEDLQREVLPDAMNLALEFVSKMATENKNVDNEWAAFQDKLKGARYNEWADEVNKSPLYTDYFPALSRYNTIK
ncbi:MAG: hypothetical protein FIA99_19765 [Ruminiclostridium sp.]|nr:hypothetical protein [Ruminiclostridium sp.]